MAMTSTPDPRDKRVKLRRSFSEHLRSSTSKAWGLLWRRVRERRLAEIEAKEACEWLRAAGFPQYAQLFEDSQFPIDITPVKRDHNFLDKDLVEPLCRRLNTLNKCASMKLDVHLPKKKSEDSDEDDVFAISDRWTFEWTSRRWSRLQDIDSLLGHPPDPEEHTPLRPAPSSESVLTDLSEPEVSSLHSESSGGDVDPPATPDPTPLTTTCVPDNCGRLADKHGKAKRAKDFLRHVEALRSPREHKDLIISAPLLKQDARALTALRCVDVMNRQNEVNRRESKGTSSQSSQSGSDSSHSGGSTVSTPSLKERKVHRADHKRSGMYLEDVDILIHGNKVAEENRRNEFCSYGDLVVHVPQDHKPGTFPKALSIESLSPTNGAPMGRYLDSELMTYRGESRPVTPCGSRGNRLSV